MENNNKTDWSKRDIGALWKRESATQKYLSGYVKIDELGIEREVKVVVFSNKNKKDNAKAPDYRIYVSTPQKNEEKAASQVSSETKESKKTVSKAVKQPAIKTASEDLIEEEDVL